MNIKKELLKNKNEALLIELQSDFNQNEILNQAAKCLDNGAKIIQFCSKKISDKDNIETAYKLRQLCSIYNSLLIINSRLDIAQLVCADGICLFENDMTIKQAKKLMHDDLIIGHYAKNQDELMKFSANQPDYICLDFTNSAFRLNNIKLIKLKRCKL